MYKWDRLFHCSVRTIMFVSCNAAAKYVARAVRVVMLQYGCCVMLLLVYQPPSSYQCFTLQLQRLPSMCMIWYTSVGSSGRHHSLFPVCQGLDSVVAIHQIEGVVCTHTAGVPCMLGSWCCFVVLQVQLIVRSVDHITIHCVPSKFLVRDRLHTACK